MSPARLFQAESKFLRPARAKSSVIIPLGHDVPATGQFGAPPRRGEHEVSIHSEGKQSMTSLQPYMDWEANGPSYLAEIDVEEELKSTTEEEVWHVAIAWDDIKTMSLDQLDDAFRLDVIAADTPVW